ncbi:MAG: ABC transporter permease [Actinomycetaceae bacterium]|nr:ABC transporter permease [Actinomycetaceae bacterium]MDY6083174.1 ABC transporter permease [Actinomycetaceae bacterium]
MENRHRVPFMRIGAPVIFGLVLVSLWFIATATGFVDTHFLPTPSATFNRLGAGVSDGYLLSALGTSVVEALLGTICATLVGVPLGYVIAKSRFAAALLHPYIAASQAIPAVAIAPLLTIWIGYGLMPIVVLCTLMVVFPMIVTSSVALASIDPSLMDAAKLDGATTWQLLRYIEFPLALPMVISGLRTGATLSISGAIVGEMIIGGRGLGLQLTSAQGAADVQGMFAIIVLLALAAAVLYSAFLAAERAAATHAGFEGSRR